ncbi:uncharacterized protein LOC135083832 isoform X2 [Ostrinia nubilalis]
MVYLLKSEKSNMNLYDSWLCGGAIVSPTFILTSAACLSDVTYLYAIAGYDKYVKSEDLDSDPCTRERKQKIVKTCIPQRYKFSYGNFVWTNIDIGLAIVEKPYDFNDITYRAHCSYVPGPIRINFSPLTQINGTDVYVYGWGHALKIRTSGDYQDYNQEYLQVTTSRIVEKSYCLTYFKNLTDIINNFMICCTGTAYVFTNGTMDAPISTYNNGCTRRNANGNCDKPDYLNYDYGFDSRRNANFTVDKTSHNSTDLKGEIVRRQGVICQNDHGGPLVAWVGSEELVLGVASTSLHSQKLHCIPPHLYTSTQCTSLFLKCALKDPSASRKSCDEMGKIAGYEIHETEIDWGQHDGNANNDANGTKTNAIDKDVFNWNPNESDKKNKGDLRTNEENPNKNIDSVEDVVIL